MKKIFALFITFAILTLNSCYAFSELYYLKNTSVSNWQNIIKAGYTNQDYSIVKENPYYGVSQYYANDYAIVILQQSGSNMFYYYNSNDNKKINKYILKQIKNSNIVYERSYDGNIIGIYDNIAARMIGSNGVTTSNYVFNDNETTYSNNNKTTIKTTTTSSSNTLKGYVARIDAGTKINIYLQGAINTSTASVGDKITAVVTKDIRYNGTTIIPQGSLVYGVLTKARHAQYGSRNGRVTMDFSQIVTPDGKTYEISAEKIDFAVTNEGKVGEVTSNVVVGALIGGLAGLLVGALSSSHNIGTATAIGAGVGAGGALISGAAERGVDAEIPSFTELELTLIKPFNATIY